MSLVKDILRINARYFPLGHRQIYEHLYKETPYGRKLNKRTLSATLSRMKSKGLITQRDGVWSVTQDGLTLSESGSKKLKQFSHNGISDKSRRSKKGVIVIFDIPEKMKTYRDWLRSELAGLGFTLIQKSVWLGPSLPKEFISYLDEIGLLRHVRFFRATEEDLI